MITPLIASPIGAMVVLVGVVSFWFWLERKTRWNIFNFLPPLIFVYASPVLLSNSGVIPFESAAYDFLRQYGLPVFIVLMLIKVDVLSTVRIMGKGVLVMLLGSVGVVMIPLRLLVYGFDTGARFGGGTRDNAGAQPGGNDV